MISSGKDGRLIAWSVGTGEVVAEVRRTLLTPPCFPFEGKLTRIPNPVVQVTPTSNWAFSTSFCPSNPSVISVSSLSGTVDFHSLQSTNVSQDAAASPAVSSAAAGADLFDQVISANAANHPTKSLAYQPKWLKRPASVAFGFGGKLVSIHHDKITAAVAAAGQPQAPSHPDYYVPKVQVRRVVTASAVVDAAEALERAATGLEEGGLAKFCDDRLSSLSSSSSTSTGGTEEESWKLLKTLFRASAGGATSGREKREQLVELLGGFDRDELKARVDEAVKVLRAKLPPLPGQQEQEQDEGEGEGTETPGTSDATTNFTKLAGGESEAGESEVTEPSLFGGDNNNANGGAGGAFSNGGGDGGEDDFFGSLGARQPPSALPPHLRAGGEFHHDAAGDSSVAATIGSSPSSAAGGEIRRETFKLYTSPSLSSPYDNTTSDDPSALVTQSLVLGDFESAVALSLASENYADALLFALQSSSAPLLASVQAAYFARRAASQPYLRVLESVVGADLNDVVQHAELDNWKEVFVVCCTFAGSEEEFASLVEGLGSRCELRWRVEKDREGGSAEGGEQVEEWRKNAVLCFLAAGRLEKVVGVWVEQMGEEEEKAFAAGAFLVLIFSLLRSH